MSPTEPSEGRNFNRRRFFGTAAVTLAAAQLGMISSAAAQSATATPPILLPAKPAADNSFGRIKQIDAGLLNVAYAEAGPVEVPRSFFCTAGPMTFTALPRSRRCWRRPATG